MEVFNQETFLNVGYLWCMVFVLLARIFNAFADRADHNWSENVYYKFSKVCYDLGLFDSLDDAELWFNKSEGWRNKYIDRDPAKGLIKWNFLGITYNKPVQLCDSWHFFKMIEIMCWCFAPSIMILYGIPSVNWIAVFVSFTAFGVLGNLVFNLFYNDILSRY
jgi:hypothetical protein